MTVRECINSVDALKPNQFGDEEKVRWLRLLDQMIYVNVIQTHEMNEGEEIGRFPAYTVEDMDHALIAQTPHDELYVAYLKMKIDEENGETARYNNSAAIYNMHFAEFTKWYNRTHMPIGKQLIIF